MLDDLHRGDAGSVKDQHCNDSGYPTEEAMEGFSGHTGCVGWQAKKSRDGYRLS
jgi:hypothetical protein